MDQNKLMNFIQNLNSSPQSLEKVQKLLGRSAQTMELLKKLQAASPEEKEAVREEFLTAQREIVADYEGMLADMGLTREMLEEFASNPKNFSPKDWDFLQEFKGEMVKETQAALVPAAAPKKEKKAKLRTKTDWLSA
jgi:hypothetical protein